MTLIWVISIGQGKRHDILISSNFLIKIWNLDTVPD